jgi:hypothetical protein
MAQAVMAQSISDGRIRDGLGSSDGQISDAAPWAHLRDGREDPISDGPISDGPISDGPINR